MNDNFHTEQRDDNILLIQPYNTNKDTIAYWEQAALARLDACSEPEKRLYDVRQLQGVSMYALRMLVRLRAHPNADLVYTAVLTNNNRVMNLIKTFIHRTERVRLFHDKTEAITWLNTQVPVD